MLKLSHNWEDQNWAFLTLPVWIRKVFGRTWKRTFEIYGAVFDAIKIPGQSVKIAKNVAISIIWERKVFIGGLQFSSFNWGPNNLKCQNNAKNSDWVFKKIEIKKSLEK